MITDVTPSVASSASRSSRRRDAILEGALECFTRLGYANATIVGRVAAKSDYLEPVTLISRPN